MLNDLLRASYVDAAGDIHSSLKLEPRYENALEVVSKLVDLDPEPTLFRASIQTAGISSYGSLKNIVDAYKNIHTYLSDNYDDLTKLKAYWGYLANSVVFIQISTDISSALKIFETINERGVGLNPMDLLKNLLFSQVRQEQFAQLKDEWKKITGPLEHAGEKPLRFLRYFVMANFEIKSQQSDAVVREDEIYDWFTDKQNALACDYVTKPLPFVRRIIRNVDHYLAFAKGFDVDGSPSPAMDNLRQLCGGAFSLHYILLLAASNYPKGLLDHFITQLESFLFYYIFTKTPTKQLERNFSDWADELREVGAVTDQVAQREKFNSFLVERFEKAMLAKEGELSDALRRYTIYSMQQYRTRYLLAKLTQHVDMAYKGLSTPGSLRDYLALEIEHILPNTPSTELRDDFGRLSPQTDYDDYKARLGNLTLLEKPINIVASNDFFAGKTFEYRKCSNYLTRSIVSLTTVGSNTSITRINERLKSFEDWTAESIDTRTEVLLGLVRDVWKITPAPLT